MEKDITEKLKIYQDLLLKWQPKINLVSSSTLDNAWERHFEDSAQIAGFIPKEAKKLVDLGSGAGFPGLVLAIMRPDIDVSLIESDQKKCSFLKTVSRETGICVTVHNDRIEDVSHETEPDVVTARALASLKGLFEYCKSWIITNPKITLIFMKGAKADIELEELAKSWTYDCRTFVSKTDENAKILVFSNIYPVSVNDNKVR